jgi:hypothetical protein
MCVYFTSSRRCALQEPTKARFEFTFSATAKDDPPLCTLSRGMTFPQKQLLEFILWGKEVEDGSSFSPFSL